MGYLYGAAIRTEELQEHAIVGSILFKVYYYIVSTVDADKNHWPAMIRSLVQLKKIENCWQCQQM